MRCFVFLLCSIGLLCFISADSPRVLGEEFKQLPPAGIPIDTEVREELSERVRALQGELESAAAKTPDAQQWRPDVEVLIRSVRLALEQNLFFKKSEPTIAGKLLDEADRRLAAATSGQRGLQLLGFDQDAVDEAQLLVGGFRSGIDDSVQPYGLVVPVGYVSGKDPSRVDVWLHGRGDTKTEIPFLNERMTKVGQYAPADTFVLHPFGRHCNAFKFAGETDVFESLDHLRTLIEVDERRIAIRGFSMGGAGCWHLAVHYPTQWFAANPGAGFVDTLVYQGWQEKTPFAIDSTREKLLKLYDVLPWVRNLKNTQTVAYSGEVDKQKQAADRVVEVAAEIDIRFPYVIGEGMGHKVNPESAAKVTALLDERSAQVSEQNAARAEIDFTTYTLRYNRADWVSVIGMGEHWKPATVRGKLVGVNEIYLTTRNVTRLKLDFRDSGWPVRPVQASLMIDGHQMKLDDWDDAPGIQCELEFSDEWKVVEEIDNSLRKKPGLQGPIDDAFYERFVFVIPSRPAKHGVVQRWLDREITYAKDRWKRLMRGEVRVVKDSDLTEKDIQTCHLICFGDFTSNQYLRGVAKQLPLTWTRDELKIGEKTFNSNVHAAIFCFPNPRNPERYLVANSGMTFRDFSNVSNSRQIAMLPDWAIMDVSDQSNDDIFSGKIVADGFFTEQWTVKP
ncbi:MAG: prolyl oligopeptidase family serine peptidase [Rubripirellula sp.]